MDRGSIQQPRRIIVLEEGVIHLENGVMVRAGVGYEP